MKGDKIKVILIYILILIIIGLIGYLIYFVVNMDKEGTDAATNKNETKSNTPEVLDNCTYSITQSQFSDLVNAAGTVEACSGLTKYKITDIILDGKTQNVEVVYSNKDIGSDDTTTGFYINGSIVVDKVATNYKVQLGTFEDKLFILATNAEASNVFAYNSLGVQIYNLETALGNAKVSDPAFVEIAKINPGLNPILTTSQIDINSFVFDKGFFTFSSDSKLGCIPGQTYKGSNYKVAYSGTTFNNPEFVSYSNC